MLPSCSHNLWTNLLNEIQNIEVVKYIIKYIECLSPPILTFEHKQNGRNKKNYTLFILHYFEYYSKFSKENQFVTKFDVLITSDMESIHQRDDESIDDYDSVESGKIMTMNYMEHIMLQGLYGKN